MLKNSTRDDIALDDELLPGNELSSVEETEEETETQTVVMNHSERRECHTIKNMSVKPDNKYKFERSLGMGGMKAVLQVWNMDTARSVAMAVIPDAEDRPPEDIQRFVNEARLTARLEHPNIVPVHDIGVDKSGSPYFTMKLLRGKTLTKLINDLSQGNIDPKKYDLMRMLRIFVKVCNAIAFAHSKNIIHLDLKPDNIYIGDFGEVLVLDWGLAKELDDEDGDVAPLSKQIVVDSEEISLLDKTMDGVAKGTPGYMAPEQVAGKNRERDFRSDIYALGAILYQMVTWRKPISGENVKQIMVNTVKGNIVSPRKAKQETKQGLDIPPVLEAIIMKAMSLDQADRYQSVKELRNDIFSFIGGFATQAESPGSVKRTVMFINRNQVKITLISIAVMVLAIIILIFTNILEVKLNI